MRSILIPKMLIEQFISSRHNAINKAQRKTMDIVRDKIIKDIKNIDIIKAARQHPFLEKSSVMISIASTLVSSDFNNNFRRYSYYTADLEFPMPTTFLKVHSEATKLNYQFDSTRGFMERLLILESPEAELFKQLQEFDKTFALEKHEIKKLNCLYGYKNSKALFAAHPEIQKDFYEMFKDRWDEADEKAKVAAAKRKKHKEEIRQFQLAKAAKDKELGEKHAKELEEIKSGKIEKNEKAKDISRAVAKAALFNSNSKLA